MADNDILKDGTVVKIGIPADSSLTGELTEDTKIITLVVDSSQHNYAKSAHGGEEYEIQGMACGPPVPDAGQHEVTEEVQMEEGEVDTHSCASCKLVFTSLEEYIRHKLSTDNCKVRYTKNRRTLIPSIVKKTREKERPARPPGKKRGPKQTHTASAHKQEDILSDEPQYRCEICSRAFGRSAALRWHVANEHRKKDSDEDYSEDDDVEVIKTEQDFEDDPNFEQRSGHKIRTDEPSVVITSDQQVFEADQNDPATSCSICGKHFNNSYVLRTHYLTHSDHRYYRCTWEGCTYAFKTKGSLKRHLRRHTGERPYKCDKCGRCFTESGALTRHWKARTSCTKKTDNDYPRYGKRLALNAPAQTNHQSDSENIQAVQITGPISALVEEKGMLVTPSQDSANTSVLTESGVITLDMSVPSPSTSQTEQPENQACVDPEEALPDSQSHQVEGISEEDGIVTCEVVDANTVQYVVEQIVADGGEGEMDKDDIENSMPHETVPLHPCNVCEEKFTETTLLQDHLKGHFGKDPLKCGICQLISSTPEMFLEHMVSAHRTAIPQTEAVPLIAQPICMSLEKITANEAGNETSDGVFIIVDKDAASKEQSILISEINKALHQYIQLYNSKLVSEKLNPGKRGLFQCPVCLRFMRGGAYLKLHMRTHTGEKPHECSQCEKTFHTKDALTKHQAAHSNERNFKCGECGKMFKRISHVREHLKVHSNERPYPCNICLKSFKTANACKVHLRTHTDYMPFRCGTCGKQFREKSSLERHIRIHTGEKPFSCKHCGRQFAEHGTLNRHLKAKVPCSVELKQRRAEQGVAVGEVIQAVQDVSETDNPYSISSADLMKVEHGGLEVTEGEIIDSEVSVMEAEVDSGDDSMAQQEEKVVRLTDTQHVEIPSLLAEFSNVVADTQHYIIQPDSPKGKQIAGTKYIMVSESSEHPEESMEIVMQDSEKLRQLESLPASMYKQATTSEQHMQITEAASLESSEPSMVIADSSLIITEQVFTDQAALSAEAPQAVQYVLLAETEDGQLTLMNPDTGESFQASADKMTVIETSAADMSAVKAEAGGDGDQACEDVNSFTVTSLNETNPIDGITLDQTVMEAGGTLQNQEGCVEMKFQGQKVESEEK